MFGRPLSHPEIRIKKLSEDELSFLRHYDASAGWAIMENVIALKWATNEQDAIDTLMHELEHWAHHMYIKKKVRKSILERYKLMQALGATPFQETIVTYHPRKKAETEEDNKFREMCRKMIIDLSGGI